MKTIFTCVLLATVMGFFSFQLTSDTPLQDEQTADSPILVELFTSQGCSSCPPADRVLSKLVEEANKGDLDIVALSFHVDYWNRLGWRDPYSDAAYSQRQRIYASKLPDQRVYTPEIVVNGQSGHVGSRESEVRNAIRSNQRNQKNIPFSLSLNKQKSDKIGLDFSAEGDLDDYLLQIALVDATVGNEVPRGENRGRSLQHVQVVRSFQSISSPDKEGTIEVDLSILENKTQGKVVAFLQHKDSWEVAGVKELSLVQP